jgi:uracil-DNA glycosylase family protein
MTAVRRAWTDLEQRAELCTSCDLFRNATQTVFGEGPVPASMMLVGEQPGDAEDRSGQPFVGPAGKLLRSALHEVGLDPDTVYLTNAVKHFRWEARGKRRIHKGPGAEHVRACHQWLEAELDLVHPEVVVLLGATATRALAPDRRVTRDRGRPFPLLGRTGLVTAHPSAVLRSADRDAARSELVHDLGVAASELLRPVSRRS